MTAENQTTFTVSEVNITGALVNHRDYAVNVTVVGGIWYRNSCKYDEPGGEPDKVYTPNVTVTLGPNERVDLDHYWVAQKRYIPCGIADAHLYITDITIVDGSALHAGDGETDATALLLGVTFPLVGLLAVRRRRRG